MHFSLNDKKAMEKIKSRAVGTTVYFTLDFIFLWLKCLMGKMVLLLYFMGSRVFPSKMYMSGVGQNAYLANVI